MIYSKRDALQLPNQNAKAFGCLSLLIGFILSIAIQAFLFGNSARPDLIWEILAPAWVYFPHGRDDGVEIIFATIIDTVYYGAIIYVIIYAVVRFSGRLKFQ